MYRSRKSRRPRFQRVGKGESLRPPCSPWRGRGFELLESRLLLTDVSGSVSGTWTTAASPYRLMGDAYIAAGNTLTIQTGVQVITNGNPYDLTVNGGGTLNASGAAFTIDVLNYQSGSFGSLISDTVNLAKLDLYSSSVTVQTCTFTGPDPVWTYPSLVPKFSDSTFSPGSGTASIHVSGSAAAGTTAWPALAGTKYYLDGDVTVPVGSTLSIVGAEVYTKYSGASHGYQLNVYGTVSATGATFTGYPYVYAYNGGTLNVTDCQVIGSHPAYSTWMDYEAGGLGAIANTTFTNAALRLFSNAVTLDPAKPSAFVGTDPVTTNPSLVPKLFPCTFTSSTGVATIHINGNAAAGSATWQPLGDAKQYSLDTDVTVPVGSTLSIVGAEVYTKYSGASHGYQLNVYGTVSATGATFTGYPYVYAYNGGTLNVTDCQVIGSHPAYSTWMDYEAGGLGAIANTTFTNAALRLFSNAVTLDPAKPSAFVGTDPVTTNPSLVPKLFPCTFTSSTGVATIHINGNAAAGSATWQPLGDAKQYSLDTDVTVPVGSTLSIVGAEVYTKYSGASHGYQLNVYGTVSATGATFTGYPYVYAYNGGTLNVTDCQVIGSHPAYSTWMDYEAGGLGAIANTTFTNAALRLFSNAVTLDPAKPSAFVGTDPVTTNPSLVPKLFPCTFTSSTGVATIHINGNAAAGSAEWRPIGQATKFYLESDVAVPVGSSLTINGGEVDTKYSGSSHGYTLGISGTVNATGTKFTDYPYVFVYNGGQLDLTGCQVTGNYPAYGTWIDYQKGSLGQVQFSKLSLALKIDSESSASIHYDDFSAVNVIAEGNKNIAIDLTKNWWGTTDTTAIGSKITDQLDNPALPLVNFQPFLQTLGTIDATAGHATIRIALDSSDTTKVNVFVNNPGLTPTYSWPLSSVGWWTVLGSGGNDQLTVDFTNGSPLPAGGLTYDGGATTTDSLLIKGGAGDDTVVVTPSQVLVTGASAITYSSIPLFGFDLGAGADSLLLTGGTLRTYQANAISAATAVTINGNAVLDLGGASHTVDVVTLRQGSIVNGTLLSNSYNVESGTISANLGGVGGLIKSTGGTVLLSGNNTYTGGTLISSGTLQSSGGDANVLPDTGSLKIAGGVLDLQGGSETVGDLAVISGSAVNGTLASSSQTGQSGTIAANLIGPSSLVKTGAGTLVLSGANRYAGGTTVNGGTLQVSNAVALPAGSNLSVAASGVVVFSSGFTGPITAGEPRTRAAWDITPATVARGEFSADPADSLASQPAASSELVASLMGPQVVVPAVSASLGSETGMLAGQAARSETVAVKKPATTNLKTNGTVPPKSASQVRAIDGWLRSGKLRFGEIVPLWDFARSISKPETAKRRNVTAKAVDSVVANWWR